MPHFGLMDEKKMTPEAAALLRAKLHIRCGRRRLQEKKDAEAITTLYDALQSAMRWHAMTSSPLQEELARRGSDFLENDMALLEFLQSQGVWDHSFDFHGFRELLDQALEENVAPFDRQQFWSRLETILTRLGVMPFDENELPPEDPATF